MSFFNSPESRLEEPVASSAQSSRTPFADVAGRFAHWLAGLDREQVDPEGPQDAGLNPIEDLEPGPPEDDAVSRFPLAALGYNRAVVDEHLTRLEAEIAQLRERQTPRMSVTEELEMIGQQTASILVVAHDKAHETTRRAQEQAERVIAQATAAATSITEEAQHRLRELDGETDAVWQERERLIDDVRVVSAALANLADEASERFPAAEPGATASAPVTPAPAMANWMVQTEAADPQDTMPFSVVEAEGWGADNAPDGSFVEDEPESDAFRPDDD
jgi:cell division septum initiation protein DivIVA